MTETAHIVLFDPQPRTDELPPSMPSPFAEEPHPIARRAAEALRAQLATGTPLATTLFEGLHAGKMFGVLVVVDRDGRVGYLRGFSGMVGDTWLVDGFVGPLFDVRLRDAIWPRGRAALAAFDQQRAQLAHDPAGARARAALADLDAAHAAEAAEQAVLAERRRQAREDERTALNGAGLSPQQRDVALAALAQGSRADTVAQRQRAKSQRAAREPFARVLRDLEKQRVSIKECQTALSLDLAERLYAGYQIDNVRGERKSLRELFAPVAPPGGAGDCAAPKLFAHAFRHGLRPLALAEFWVGTPSSAAGRHSGIYHPACTRKCGPILAHMLVGLGE